MRSLLILLSISVSLKSALWSSLLKTFPEPLIFLFWLGCILPVCPLTPIKAGAWERATSALGLAPVYSVLTAIGFPPVYCVRLTLEFSPVHCEVGARPPLVASFLLVLVEAEPWGEHLGLWQVSSLVYEDFWVSRLVDDPGQHSGCRGTWEFTLCTRCIRVASIRSTVALTTSTCRSTCVNYCAYACASSSTIESWLF